jgi:hypothetical protein
MLPTLRRCNGRNTGINCRFDAKEQHPFKSSHSRPTGASGSRQNRVQSTVVFPASLIGKLTFSEELCRDARPLASNLCVAAQQDIAIRLAPIFFDTGRSWNRSSDAG